VIDGREVPETPNLICHTEAEWIGQTKSMIVARPVVSRGESFWREILF